MTTELLVVLVAVAVVVGVYYVLVYRPAREAERITSLRYGSTVELDDDDEESEEGEDEEGTVQDAPRFESHLGWGTILSIVVLVCVIATAIFNYQTGENVRKTLELTDTRSITMDWSAAQSNCAVEQAPQAFSYQGGSGGFSVATSTGSCTWTASTNEPWIALTSGSTGTGNGGVTYAVAGNGGATRTGTISVAGKTVTIVQSGR